MSNSEKRPNTSCVTNGCNFVHVARLSGRITCDLEGYFRDVLHLDRPPTNDEIILAIKQRSIGLGITNPGIPQGCPTGCDIDRFMFIPATFTD